MTTLAPTSERQIAERLFTRVVAGGRGRSSRKLSETWERELQ